MVQIIVPGQDSGDVTDIMFFAPVSVTLPDGDSRYWGQIVISLDVHAFYRRVGLFDTEHSEILLALRKPEAPPAKEMLLAGNPMVFDMNPLVRNIPVPMGVWELAAVPQNGWTVSPYKAYIVVGGIIAVILVPASFWAVPGYDNGAACRSGKVPLPGAECEIHYSSYRYGRRHRFQQRVCRAVLWLCAWRTYRQAIDRHPDPQKGHGRPVHETVSWQTAQKSVGASFQ